MVEHKTKHLDRVFHALADNTRRQLLQRIAQYPACHVTQLAEPFHLSLNAVSKHLKVLEQAGLVKRRKKGRIHYLEFNQDALDEAADLINQLKNFWGKQLDSLENFLKKSP